MQRKLCVQVRWLLLVITITSSINVFAVEPSLTSPEEQSRQNNLDTLQQQRRIETQRQLQKQQETKPDVRQEIGILGQQPTISLAIPDSPLGGHQGDGGRIGTETFYFEYASHSFLDKVVESFAGTHDTFNSFIWYDELGNGKKLDGLAKVVGDVTNATNVPLATPFALSVLLPPDVWNAALTALKLAKP